jgi:hypothetical protein
MKTKEKLTKHSENKKINSGKTRVKSNMEDKM